MLPKFIMLNNGSMSCYKKKIFFPICAWGITKLETYVTVAGSLSPETSTIPVDSYQLDHDTGEQLWWGYAKESYSSYLMSTEYYFL